MKTTLCALLLVLAGASTAAAQDDDSPAPELICLDDLDVGPALDVAHEIAPRARMRAHRESNCLLVIGHADRVAAIRDVLARLEERARSRSRRGG